jgi:hypothetical protein
MQLETYLRILHRKGCQTAVLDIIVNDYGTLMTVAPDEGEAKVFAVNGDKTIDSDRYDRSHMGG